MRPTLLVELGTHTGPSYCASLSDSKLHCSEPETSIYVVRY